MIALSVIPTHKVATWLIEHIHKFLDNMGLAHHEEVTEIVYVSVIVALALLLGWIVR